MNEEADSEMTVNQCNNEYGKGKLIAFLCFATRWTLHLIKLLSVVPNAATIYLC